MSYLDQSRRASSTSMAAVIAIHAGIGAVLVFGLSVAGTVIDKAPPIPSFDIKDPPPPPPPIEPEVVPDTTSPAIAPPITAPVSKLDLKPLPPVVDARDYDLPPMPPIPTPRPSATITPSIPSPTPIIAPVSASPRNDPAGWVTTGDYRSSWINRDLTGTARFRLEISAEGRVTGCTITGSTGHSELDQATCNLVTRRARFQPARGSSGEPVASTYSNAVRWVVPD
ncbi:energy transducer TonB [Qipengyuania spongiae]|uniref:Energy transducer TonB n=1 Tax=Qipengyuania spongiae TaxID=2909673 RepID=A0ABY5T5C8_9SPHN|nr:energy transducer TonB [Qipengyuania spongiae]UVI40536.1 energy transducer TonB [Qipengyuania spongiae]